MNGALATLVLVPTLLAPGGVRDRVEILERDVVTLKENLMQVRQDQTQILLELEKLNQRLGVERQEGMADLATRLDGVDEDVRVLFENLNDVDSRLRRLEERLDLALQSLYRGRGVVPGAGATPPGGSGAGPSTPPVEEMADGESDPEAGEGAEAGTGAAPRGPAAVGTGEKSGLPPGISAAPGEKSPSDATRAAGGTPPTAGNRTPGTGAEGDPAPPSMPPSIPVDPEELYQTAYTDFARGNYELAILGFQDYVKRFPATDLADNAQYWIGESHYTLGRYRQAVQAFQDVEVLYPDQDKVPDSILKRGYALIEMNQIDEGIRQLQRLIAEHPRSNAARIARGRLRSMGLSAP